MNTEQYHVVEVTGASDGSVIRERIFSKLYIADDRHSPFRVYQSQVGSFAISSALSDGMIFELCSKHGDASGSLTFFVSTSPDCPSPESSRLGAEYSKSHLLSRRQYAQGS